jgi:hypothetical protein
MMFSMTTTGRLQFRHTKPVLGMSVTMRFLSAFSGDPDMATDGATPVEMIGSRPSKAAHHDATDPSAVLALLIDCGFFSWICRKPI